MQVKEFEAAVTAAIRDGQLLCPGDRVIAAVSGGADSMALLRFLLQSAPALGIRLEAAHVNHGLREAAKRDEEFVAAFCEENGVLLHLFRAPRQKTQRSEDWARQLRYGFFEQLAAEGPVKIATAHTLTDQAETLLFRLARGTGLKGAAGIPAKRGVYIRPLLALPRSATEDYCRATGTPYVEDESNATDQYARNRIRRQVLPQLEQLNPKAQQALGEYCRLAGEWQRYFDRQGANLLQKAACGGGWRVETLRRADPVVCREALRQIVEQKHPLRKGELEKLEQLVNGQRKAAQLAQGTRLERSGGVLRWAEEAPPQQPLPAQDALPGEYQLAGGYRLRLELLEGEKCEQIKKNGQSAKKGLNNWLDYDKIGSSLSLRTRSPGDQYHPAGRQGSKTLKKFFNEKGIPSQHRALLPLLAVGSQVVWLWGEGAAEGFRPGADSRRILAVRPLEQRAKGAVNNESEQ